MSRFCVVFIVFLFSCNRTSSPQKTDNSVFSLVEKSDTLYYLNIKGESLQHAWEFNYPVFRKEEGDVNGDGSIDALVGVVKATHFDSVLRKRLFLFKNHSGYVRPLWLGSRLAHPLVDFRFIEWAEQSFIMTLELERSKRYSFHLYRWRGFGLEYVIELLSI